MPDNRTSIPTLSQIRAKTIEAFGRRPCLWQLKAVEAVLKGDKDVICISGTGSGKTLTFWMPLLFKADGIQIVVSPLNILGRQNVEQLERQGIRAISLNAQTATYENYKAIEDGHYRAVVVSPEEFMKDGGEFERLYRTDAFCARVISIVWDEAHCVSTWGDFRPEYRDARRLRYILARRDIPFLLASATLPSLVLKDVKDTLQIREDKHVLIHRSNDRPNVALSVRKIQRALNSFEDLAFVLPDEVEVGPRNAPPKFLIFFDDISESVRAAKFLRRRLPAEYRNKIKWFNADMTDAYREEQLDALRNGSIWGLCCTDSFGMGVDLPDVELVIQWRATCNLATLWQRFGRGARDLALTARALFLVEPKHFDDEKAKQVARKAK
ncbi:P-loop containing nucleoside triphosphate hydrolase protein, partial [Auriscalpium vulgare]